MVICIFCKLLSMRYSYLIFCKIWILQRSVLKFNMFFSFCGRKCEIICNFTCWWLWFLNIVLPTLTLAKLISEKIKTLVKFLCLFYINVFNMIKLLVTVFIIKLFTRINVFIKVKLPWKELIEDSFFLIIRLHSVLCWHKLSKNLLWHLRVTKIPE